ncbi:MAG: quinohemoprotein amine dehydrogenase subunit alpha [Bryobacteraceae bacterium]|nr:quinohemoprotein amine dehydrogenase subunit alpha [Bryobacteraceae bacterium]
MRRFAIVVIVAMVVYGQEGPNTSPSPDPKGPSEPGIPVVDSLVKARCSGCHKADEKGNLTRISWERTTPEGWQEIIKRMVRLNGLTLSPTEARDIVHSLSETHGLAPEEAKSVAWFWEKRQVHTEDIANETVRDACAACHPLARPQSWRRSREEWELLVAMHKGYFPVVENTSFRRPTPPGAAAGGGSAAAAAATASTPAGRQSGRNATPEQPAGAPPAAAGVEPSQVAIEEFSKSHPLHSPEWASWQAARREPRLDGRWVVSAWLPAKGRYVGEMIIDSAGKNAFTTKTVLTSVKNGEKLTRQGKAVVFTGYAWRGRSTSGKQEEKEVLSFSRNQQSAEGRWYWGGYDEFGYDVRLVRAGDGPVLLATDTTSLRKASTGSIVKIFGDSLPLGLNAADIEFGGGVRVTAIQSQSPTQISVKVDVDAAAVPGMRDLTVRRAALTSALAIYDKVDFLKIPESAVARLGGNSHPKGFVQFEAFAWSNGLDGKPNTGDDINLGPVDARWSVEEFPSHLGDDDMEFVGSLGANGLFTPSIEGPNDRRRFGTNNYGDVWITASWKAPESEKSLTAKSYLVVAVPLYIRWDSEEAGK